ncbi:MAG TPA: 3-ketoacyl-ACP reductase [Verrucomicrobiales bacterium]|nr:3-ketoacyl-ACP reductase [Verrucomicrobiales bacterium]HIL72301.1 3-ketoacyl-ACP reductase [Verrucomicrobiota bacterium]
MSNLETISTLQGQAALITGASRGIGRGIAVQLARVGANLGINYAANHTAAEETRSACIGAAKSAGYDIKATICQGNIGCAADRQAIIDHIRSEHCRLDILVNNAGITSIGRADILEATEENFDALMAINLKGPFFLSQLAGKWMIDQRRQHGEIWSPKIINISSISAYTISTNRADYCMGKAALSMMTKLYAARLADDGIQVFEVCPGVIASDMTAPVKEKYDQMFAEGLAPMRRWGTPEDVGKSVTAIALNYLPYSTGETINVDGGFHFRRL